MSLPTTVTSLLIVFQNIQLICSFSFNVNAYIEFQPIGLSNKFEPYFGYSLLLKKGNTNTIVIGAPKDNNSLIPDVKNPGMIYVCNIPKTERRHHVSCKPKSIDKFGDLKNLRKHIRHNKNNQWLGMSISGTDYTNGSTVMCAPRWKNAFYNESYLGNGICYASSQSDTENDEQDYLELTPLTNKDYQKTNAIDHLFAYGQAGISTKLSEDGSALLIGAPGVDEWRGSVIKYDIQKVHKTHYVPTLRYYLPKDNLRPILSECSYFGYSVDIGKFDKSGLDIYVGGAPRGADSMGQVLLFKLLPGVKNDLMLYQRLDGEQVGEYFGSSLLVVDINQDGLDDLIVGAPLYAENSHYDQGRAHVFLNFDGKLMRQLNYVSGDLKSGSRFGSAISQLGDINSDKFTDIAIGAPYEDDGRGAVYIYYGSSGGLHQGYAQKLQVAGTKGFGISLSKGLDIDGNNRNDFAVGAYASNQVILFKSHPGFYINIEMVSNPSQIQTTTANITIEICLTFLSHEYMIMKTDVIVILAVEEKYKRAQVENKDDFIYRVAGETSKQYCKNIPIQINTIIHDYSHPINVTAEIKQEHNPLTDKTFCPRCPVLHPDTPTRKQLLVPHDCDCGSDSVCTPDLELDVIMPSSYVIGSSKHLELTINVANRGETAYLPKVEVEFPQTTPIVKLPSNCQLTKPTLLICHLENPLLNTTNDSVSLKFDATKLRDNGKLLTFNTTAKTGIDDEALPKTNIVKAIRLKSETSIHIFGKTFSDANIIFYRDQTPSNISLSHMYNVRNHGPSPQERFHMFVFIPIAYKNSKTTKEITFANVVGPINKLHHSPFICKPTNAKYSNYFMDTQKVYKIDENDIMFDDNYTIDLPNSTIDESAPIAKTFNMDCTNTLDINCLILHCVKQNGLSVGPEWAQVLFKLIFNTSKIDEIAKEVDQIIVSTIIGVKTSSRSTQYEYVRSVISVKSIGSAPVWVIVLSAMGGILLLVLMTLGLYKVGFFKRKKITHNLMHNDENNTNQ